MPIAPTHRDLNPRFVIDCDGEDGEFFVAPNGADKEAVYAFIYGDAQIQFRFFGEYEIRKLDAVDGAAPRYEQTATIHRLSPPYDPRHPFDFDPHEAVVKRNIRRFFQQHLLIDPLIRQGPDSAVEVVFRD